MWCLGLAGGYYHDAAACLFQDGKLILCIEEERLSRVRFASNSLPKLCILACLDEAGISLANIDVIALSWNPLYPNELDEIPPNHPFITELFPSHIFGALKANVVVVDHQLSHAASAFRTSKEEEALVISADGAGDFNSLAVFHGDRYGLKLLESKDISQSLGWFYQRITTFLGVGTWQHAGKTMALAAYGEPRYKFDFIHVDEGEDYEIQFQDFKKNELMKPGKVEKEEFYKWHREFIYAYCSSLGINQSFPNMNFDRVSGYRIYTNLSKNANDLAASAQKIVEDALAAIVSKYIRKYSLSALCMAGGVAMNCKAMGQLLERVPGLSRIHVPPGAGDMGGAIGAALEVLHRLGICSKYELEHAYWGFGYDDDQIISYLKGIGLRVEILADPSDCAAEMISQGNIIGWFQGRMEFGARALGNRSILARPDSEELRLRINATIKNRETWRPFSPSITSGQLLREGWKYSSQASPFMTVALPGTSVSDQFPGIRHIDGTSRLQTVSPQINIRYYSLLKGIESRLGYPLILNTSLNARDEPIACRPVDALKVFVSTPLDAIIVGNCLLKK